MIGQNVKRSAAGCEPEEPLFGENLRSLAVSRHTTIISTAAGPKAATTAQLWRELVTLGFVGRSGTVRQWAGRRRKGKPQAANTAERVTTREPGSARQIARQLMTEDTLPQTEQNFVSRLLLQVPGLAEGVKAEKRLNAVLRRKSKETLDKVLDDAGNTALESFVSSLRRDFSAVQAALELPWSTSPAEGQINRLKMLKRMMYGGASFRLLRARVMYAT